VIALAAAALVTVAILLFTNIPWATLLWMGIVGLVIFRYIRNRKRRMLKNLVSKVSRFEGVRAIRVKDDKITVVADKTQANLYIRVNSMVDNINKKLYIGRSVEAVVRDDLSPDEFQNMLRETNIVYVRDDIVLAEREL
jgi:hypothetical protein